MRLRRGFTLTSNFSSSSPDHRGIDRPAAARRASRARSGRRAQCTNNLKQLGLAGAFNHLSRRPTFTPMGDLFPSGNFPGNSGSISWTVSIHAANGAGPVQPFQLRLRIILITSGARSTRRSVPHRVAALPPVRRTGRPRMSPTSLGRKELRG